MAGYIYEVCHEAGIQISGFVVSEIQKQSVLEKDRLPIISVYQVLEEEKEVLFLIGAIKNNRNQMLRFLIEHGFKNYIDIPEGIYEMNPWLALKKKVSMVITPIVGCSVWCKFCPQRLFVSRYYERDKQRSGRMTFSEYKICPVKLPVNMFIEFSGFVESFLNPESIDMMEYTYNRGYRLSLFTTLVGVDQKGFEKIRKISFECVVLHTHDADQYANIPLTDQYWELLDAVLDAKRADGTSFITAANCQGIPSERFLELAHGRVEVISHLHDWAGNLKVDDMLNGSERTGTIFCSVSHNLNRNVLLPDGSVVLCCNDFRMKHVLENLLTKDYDHIMQSEENKAYNEY